MRKLEAVGRTPFSILLDHFEHAANIAGVDHVGLGSDFDGVTEELPTDMEDISKIPNLIPGLRERGFADDSISKILGENTLRVMREAEAYAHAGKETA
jgi:membrane dipeptidase